MMVLQDEWLLRKVKCRLQSLAFQCNPCGKSSPQPQNVNWTYIRCSEDVLDVFWTSYVQFMSCAYGDKNKQGRVATLKLSLVEHLLQLETISMIDHWERPSDVLWRSSCQTRSKAPDMYKNASYFKWGICVKWPVNVVLFREADAHINHRAGSLIDYNWKVHHPLNI